MHFDFNIFLCTSTDIVKLNCFLKRVIISVVLNVPHYAFYSYARSGASKPAVTAFKWVDSHQPKVEYTGDYTARDLITFVHKATLPLVVRRISSIFILYVV